MKLLEAHEHHLRHPNINRRRAGAFAGLFAVVGAVVLVSTFAAGNPIAFEPETGTLAGGATTSTVTGQSGSGAVKFGAATPTPTPTPGGFRANCITKPSDCGYPDATNTGVPAGVTLTNSGSVTVTQNGAVVQNLNIINDGQIVVRASNVTIKNVRIKGCTYYPIDYPDSGQYTGLVVQDTEIESTCWQTTACISFSGYTAIRVHCHGASDGFKANSNAVIRDSYVHDMWVTADSHNDGVQTLGGNNVTLDHNTIDLGSAGVCVQFGTSNSDWLVTNNLFRCTGWSLNGNAGTANSTFTGNRFARVSGWYGPSGLGEGTNITWSGNYFDDTGAVVNR